MLKRYQMERLQFTPQQRAFLVTEYHRHRNIGTALQRFQEEFPDVRYPSRKTVTRNVQKFSLHGTSHNLNKGRSGRRRSARTEENVQAVQNLLNGDQPNGEIISARRNGLGLSSATFNRITRLDLRFHPFQMIRRHQLLAGDYQRRQQFCHWLLAQNARFLENVIIGDEAGFALNASINTHNVRHYAPRGQQPLDFQFERNDDRHKLTVWVGLMGNGNIIGPFFFQGNVDGEGYLQMINQQVVPALRRMRRFGPNRDGRFQRLWWIQDGAARHLTGEELSQNGYGNCLGNMWLH